MAPGVGLARVTPGRGRGLRPSADVPLDHCRDRIDRLEEESNPRTLTHAAASVRASTRRGARGDERQARSGDRECDEADDGKDHEQAQARASATTGGRRTVGAGDSGFRASPSLTRTTGTAIGAIGHRAIMAGAPSTTSRSRATCWTPRSVGGTSRVAHRGAVGADRHHSLVGLLTVTRVLGTLRYLGPLAGAASPGRRGGPSPAGCPRHNVPTGEGRRRAPF
jgi:hypothetical protein